MTARVSDRRRPPAVPVRRARRAGRSVEVVGEAEDVDSAVAAIDELKPDVVLLDVHMPGGGGQEVLRRVLGPGSRCGSSRCRCPTRPRTSSA